VPAPRKKGTLYPAKNNHRRLANAVYHREAEAPMAVGSDSAHAGGVGADDAGSARYECGERGGLDSVSGAVDRARAGAAQAKKAAMAGPRVGVASRVEMVKAKLEGGGVAQRSAADAGVYERSSGVGVAVLVAVDRMAVEGIRCGLAKSGATSVVSRARAGVGRGKSLGTDRAGTGVVGPEAN
jgi:hypothetical protein